MIGLGFEAVLVICSMCVYNVPFRKYMYIYKLYAVCTPCCRNRAHLPQCMKEAISLVSRTLNQPFVYSLCEWGWVSFLVLLSDLHENESESEAGFVESSLAVRIKNFLGYTEKLSQFTVYCA